MNRYKWRGINSNGKECHGIIDASSFPAVQEQLLQKNIALISLQQHHPKIFSTYSLNFFSKKSLSTSDLIFFFSSLSTLLSSGITVREAVRITALQATHIPALKLLCENAIQGLESGIMLSHILQKKLKSYTFISPLIAASEHSGTLSTACDCIVTYLKKRTETVKIIKAAALLPAITLTAALSTLLGMSFIIAPRFQMLYASFDKELPKFTRRLFAFLMIFQTKLFWLCLIFIIPILLILRNRRPPFISRCLSTINSLLPISKTVKKYHDQLYFFQTLSLLLQSGIPLISALSLSKEVVSENFSKQIEGMLHEIESGSLLNEAMQRRSYFFSGDQCALMALGERSGTVASSSKMLTERVQESYNSYLHFLTTFFQPLLISIVGGLIAVILYALYAPLLNLASLL